MVAPPQQQQQQQGQGQGMPGQPGQQQVQLTQAQFQMIQQLANSPEFVAIRQQARQNPQIIPQLLQFLQHSNPELYQLFQANPTLLIGLIMGGVQGLGEEGGQGQGQGQEQNMGGGGQLDLSEDDVAAIENVG